MNTTNYIAGDQLGADLETLLGGKTIAAFDAPLPPEAFLSRLPPAGRSALEALAARLQKGTFPDLHDFNVEWGHDTKPFRNVDPDAFALANDGAGNYWLVTADGAVRSWCHDEGGMMEDHNSFASLDDAVACLVRYTAVRKQRVPFDDVRAVFEEKGDENGWSFFQEMLDEA